MQVLVNGATAVVREYQGDPHLGRLTSPRAGNSIFDLATCGNNWGADNDALYGVHAGQFYRMAVRIAETLKQIEADSQKLLRFVSVPDAVERTADGIRGDWSSTKWLFRQWQPALLELRLPVAIVLQNGATRDDIPWGQIQAVFVGGSDDWKLHYDTIQLCRYAKQEYGLWVHVGRVNSMERLGKIEKWGAGVVDSFDGGQFSMFSRTYIPMYLRRLAFQQRVMEDLLYA